jgi:hypothetical protein
MGICRFSSVTARLQGQWEGSVPFCVWGWPEEGENGIWFAAGLLVFGEKMRGGFSRGGFMIDNGALWGLNSTARILIFQTAEF